MYDVNGLATCLHCQSANDKNLKDYLISMAY